MTPAEIETEATYRHEERLGILCGDGTPTPEAIAMARADADSFKRQHTEPEQIAWF